MADGHIVRFVGACGVVASQMMNLSAIPSIIEIVHARSTLSYPSFPIVIGVTNAIHNIFYALSRGNEFVIYSSFMSLILNSVFLVIHSRFSSSHSSITREVVYFPVLTNGISLILVTTRAGVRTCIQDPTKCIQDQSLVLGTISTIVATLSYCGQLSTFRRVVRTKNSSSISPWMTAGVLVRAFCWFAYSYLISDLFYLTSTSIGLFSAAVQIALLILYPRIRKLE